MDADGGDDDDQGTFSFWFGGENELLISHPSEKIGMGGNTPEYQHFDSNFVALLNMANELTSWNKSIGC